MVKRQTDRLKRMKRELREVRSLAFGPPKDSPYPDTDYVEIERDSIVRARVLLDSAMIEELTALIIMNHVLKSDSKYQETAFFGRSKRYRVLYDDVLGRLPARHKMSIVRNLIRVPRSVSKTIERMLALRDLFAHVATLDYNEKPRLQYKGHNILSKAGFTEYVDDSWEAKAFLIDQSRVLEPPTKRSSLSRPAGVPSKAERRR